MDAWINTFGVFLIPYLLLVAGSGVLSTYYLSRTMEHIRKEKRWIIFLPPAWLLDSEFLDDEGNRYRFRAALTTVIFCVAVVVGWFIVYQ